MCVLNLETSDTQSHVDTKPAHVTLAKAFREDLPSQMEWWDTQPPGWGAALGACWCLPQLDNRTVATAIMEKKVIINKKWYRQVTFIGADAHLQRGEKEPFSPLLLVSTFHGPTMLKMLENLKSYHANSHFPFQFKSVPYLMENATSFCQEVFCLF